jgi:hypothetical protein
MQALSLFRFNGVGWPGALRSGVKEEAAPAAWDIRGAERPDTRAREVLARKATKA